MSSVLEIAAEDIFDETVLDALPVGVIVLDRDGYVVKYNRFEEQLARRLRREVIGRHFFEDVAICTDNPEVRGRFDEHVGSNTLAADFEYSFALPFLPRPRDVRLRMRSFEIRGHVFGVILVEDITLTKQLERHRQSLLDLMVHDLRNPLHGIVGYASLLEAGQGVRDLSEQEHAEALRTIKASALHMDELLKTTLAKVRGLRSEWTPVNLHALVLSTLGNQLPVAKDRGLHLVYGDEPFFNPQFPKRAIEVHGSVAHLASLVQNLVSNAIKYAESEVRIELEEREGNVELRVVDDGRGIAPEDHGRIFEEGYQAEGSLPGTGLGLASVRRVAKEHGGGVDVRSEPGQGSVFQVSLAKDLPPPE